ncbi:MAG: magnesium transporter CorA family protein [Sandaracinaceae bacterium]|nr:magnesium transporter CorA family protein [Sandaracinaceae bacterium]
MLERVDEMSGGGAWIVANRPSDEERQALVATHGVPEHLLAHALDPDERPRIAKTADATLVVLRMPRRMPQGSDVPWATVPLSLVLGARDAVTIALDGPELVDRVRAAALSEPCAPHRVVLAHLRAAADAFLEATADVERAIDAEEAHLSRSLGNREVLALVRLMKSLVIFASALKSLELVVQRLRETHWLEVPEEDRGALEDTLIEIRQALEIVNLERETLAVTMDAFASVISNNLNDVMKLLAAVTVILTPPLAVAGYWGMNVPVPWSGQPWAFAAIIAVSILSSFVCALELRRRRWM